MKAIVKVSSSKDFLVKALMLLSNLQSPEGRITMSEAEILARFMDLPIKFKHFRFDRQARYLVASSYTEPLGHQAMSNRILSLTKKGYIVKGDDRILVPSPAVQRL